MYLHLCYLRICIAYMYLHLYYRAKCTANMYCDYCINHCTRIYTTVRKRTQSAPLTKIVNFTLSAPIRNPFRFKIQFNCERRRNTFNWRFWALRLRAHKSFRLKAHKFANFVHESSRLSLFARALNIHFGACRTNLQGPDALRTAPGY